MNATLKQALAEKQNRKPVKSKIVQTRMDIPLHAAAGKILKKKGVRWGEFFRQAARQLVRDAH